jgi:DNA-binding CsgD family transcriptional regulator
MTRPVVREGSPLGPQRLTALSSPEARSERGSVRACVSVDSGCLGVGSSGRDPPAWAGLLAVDARAFTDRFGLLLRDGAEVLQRVRDGAGGGFGGGRCVGVVRGPGVGDELARVGLRRPVITEGLTPAQQRVAELVAAGMSNREIAATLYMRVRSVEAHLTKAYRELDVRSRSELVAALAASNDTGKPESAALTSEPT